jgi:signal transduction histidine kinase
VLPDGELHLWVTDTGVGLTEGAGTGTGLGNLQERLHAFFGAGATVTLTSHTPRGVRADIHAPLHGSR